MLKSQDDLPIAAGCHSPKGDVDRCRRAALEQASGSRPLGPDAFILSGDVAVVETTSQAVPGDIVVAEIDGDYTIKELQVDRHGARLVPHRAGSVSRRPTRTFNVLGVVKGRGVVQ